MNSGENFYELDSALRAYDAYYNRRHDDEDFFFCIDVETPEPAQPAEPADIEEPRPMLLEIRAESWSCGVYVDGDWIDSLYPSQCKKDDLIAMGFQVGDRIAEKKCANMIEIDAIIYDLKRR